MTKHDEIKAILIESGAADTPAPQCYCAECGYDIWAVMFSAYEQGMEWGDPYCCETIID